MRAIYGNTVAPIVAASGVRDTGEHAVQMLPAWEAHGFGVGFACLCAALLLATLGQRWRRRHAAARFAETQRIRRYERESIARSLHDTYLQSVQGLMLSTDAALKKLPSEEDVRIDLEVLLLRMGRVLAEGRDLLGVLRCAFVSSHQFQEALLRDLDVIVPHAGARVCCHGLDRVDRLSRHLQHDVYNIVREAVANALKHTNGMVAVHVSTPPGAFVLSIVDEGNGFGDFINGKPGHYGLQGMRERSLLLGARLEFSDRVGRGACVTLTLRASLAYRNPDEHGRDTSSWQAGR